MFKMSYIAITGRKRNHPQTLHEKSNIAIALLYGILIGGMGAQLLSPAQADTTTTLVKTDDKAIHLIVDGKEIARIDANGLRVNGNIEYTGTMADKGAKKP